MRKLSAESHELQDLRFASRGRSRGAPVEARVFSLLIEEDLVRVDHLLRDVQL